jgi:serine protease AprX
MPEKHGIQKRSVLEKMLFGERGLRRYTQDSAILPDVWIEYGKRLDKPMDLLLSPWRDQSSGRVALLLEKRLEAEQQTPLWKQRHKDPETQPSVAYNQTTVAVRLYFDEMVRVVLPMTEWWSQNINKEKPKPVSKGKKKKLDSFGERRTLASLLSNFVFQRETIRLLSIISKAETVEEIEKRPVAPEILWLIRIVGTIEYARNHPQVEEDDLLKIEGKPIYDSFLQVVKGLKEIETGTPCSIFAVSRNREANVAIFRSVLSVKGDAARNVFKSAGKGITWAVIDSGIDATHPAFRKRNQEGKILEPPFFKEDGRQKNQTRVKATYNFTKIRDLLSEVRKKPVKGKKEFLNKLDPAHAKEMRSALQRGGFIDWELLAPQFKIEHDFEYERPGNDHGTHVACILAGNCKQDEIDSDEDVDLIGMCPDLELYDLRVLNDKGVGDEFSIQAALQFVRYLNAHMDYTVIHGVNLSLSIRHDVANYACGATPVCEECERLVDAGIVVVAAAGNEGYLQYMTVDGTSEGYRSISITDPGNAEDVITVGATHSYRPHAYGVSYFSSRGPTGDGRYKPDLVAPGEKILSAVPGNTAKRKDGTSMATPHVSGAAALLMSRHREFIGRPRKIKEILCKTATDLGREKYFQGYGMVDVLRAIQSV